MEKHVAKEHSDGKMDYGLKGHGHQTENRAMVYCIMLTVKTHIK